MNHTTLKKPHKLLQLAAGAALAVAAAMLSTTVAAADTVGQYSDGGAGLVQVAFHGRSGFRSRGHNSRGFNRGLNRGFNRGFNKGFNRGFNRNFRGNRFGRSHRFSNRSRFGFNNGLSRHHGNSFRNRSSFSNQSYGNSCNEVSKVGSWNGRSAIIGGLQCYNAQGYAYVPPESRYLISYQ